MFFDHLVHEASSLTTDHILGVMLVEGSFHVVHVVHIVTVRVFRSYRSARLAARTAVAATEQAVERIVA